MNKSSKFNGTWQDQAKVLWVIESEDNLLKVHSPGGRGPFNGYEIALYHPVIDLHFKDKAPETGVLSNDGKKIYWSNGSEWVKQK